MSDAPRSRHRLVVILLALVLVVSTVAPFAFAAPVLADSVASHVDRGADSTSETGYNVSDPGFSMETVLEGFSSPTALEFLPDGRALVLEKGGTVWITNPDTGATSQYMQLDAVSTQGEQGLLNIALDPEFTETGVFYVYYVNSTTERATVSRFTHEERSGGLDSVGVVDSERTVWEAGDPASSCCHYGGGLAIDHEGRLLLTLGDGLNGSRAQDLSRAEGKIIRVDTDGTIPPDNPYVGRADALPSVYASGLRNPYSAAYDPVRDALYVGEVGGDEQEDVHVGRGGANYGWPACEGLCEDPAYDDPIFTYAHDGEGATVIVGPVYRGGMFPDPLTGVLFYGDFVRGGISYLTFDADGDVVDSHRFVDETRDENGDLLPNSDPDRRSIVHLDVGPDGALYSVQINTGSVTRIGYQSANTPPTLTDASANRTSGLNPLSVAFTGAATDVDSESLDYTWRFGDGTTASGSTVTHTYRTAGTYSAVLEVTDGNVTVTSAPITVSVSDLSDVRVCSDCQTPTDPDGDGLYEDVDGNGELTFFDVLTLYDYFRNVDSPVDAPFDFDESGDLTFFDVLTLYDEFQSS